jgi:hypothetical protein
MKEAKVWKCEWCGATFESDVDAEQHEAHCKNNQEAYKNCVTCIYGIDAEGISIPSGVPFHPTLPGYDGQSHKYWGPYCALHRLPMAEKPYCKNCEEVGYTARVRGKGPYNLVRRMSGTCQHYKYKGKAGWTKRDGTDNA